MAKMGDTDENETQSLLTEKHNHCMDKKDLEKTKRNIIKDILILAIAFTFVFTEYTAIQNLMSSLNQANGLGFISLSCLYAGMFVSSLFAPVIIQVLSAKWTIVTAFICHCIFTIANMYPRVFTLLPASLLLGLLSGALHTAGGAYITTLALAYSDIKSGDITVIINRFSGCFFTFYQSAQLWGNLISSLVLNNNQPIPNNATSNESSVMKCGSQFCPVAEDVITRKRPSEDLVIILFIIYLGCVIVGIFLIALCLRKLSNTRENTYKEINNGRSILETLKSIFKLWLCLDVLLLVPLFMYSGVEASFITGLFPQAFVSCELGVGYVGYIMMCYGVGAIISSFLFAFLEKWTGLLPIFTIAALINLSLLITLLLWKDVTKHVIFLFVTTGLWGASDSIWNSQTTALVGSLFPTKQEPAFATWRLWQAFGYAAVFAYSNYLCVDVQIYIVIAILSIAFFLCVIVLIRKHCLKSLKLFQTSDIS